MDMEKPSEKPKSAGKIIQQMRMGAVRGTRTNSTEGYPKENTNKLHQLHECGVYK